jgi:hypothetical protein
MLELKDFLRWVFRDMASGGLKMIQMLMALPARVFRRHRDEFIKDPANGWALVIGVGILIVAVLALAIMIVSLAAEIRMDRMLQIMGTAWRVFMWSTVAYLVAMLVAVKLKRFRDQRQALLDALGRNQ